MDGKEYLSSFRTGVPPQPDYAAVRDVNELIQCTHQVLAGQIGLLYGVGEIALLGVKPAPEVVARAIGDETAQSELNRIVQAQQAQNTANLQRAGSVLIAKPLKLAELAAADTTAAMTPDQLTKHIDSKRTSSNDMLVAYSDAMLGSAIFKLHRLAQKRPVSYKQASTIAKDVICNERPLFNRLISPNQGRLTIEKDFIIRKGVGQTQVDRRVLVESYGHYVSAWLKATPDWEVPLQLLCSFYTELEALIALNEWVVARQLPYLPVMAPSHYEQGKPADTSSHNTNADILLCGLVPERNEIIPVQVKNTVLPVHKKTYHPGVVLVGSKELGMQSVGHCIVQDGHRKKTGHRGITTYGNILEHYLRVYGDKGQKCRSKPSKQNREAFAALLEPAFDYFDSHITPHML